MTRYVRRVHSIDYQRNGVGGAGFYEVRFRADQGSECIAAVFYSPDQDVDTERGYCAVMSLDGPGRQNWRGDVFEDELRRAIDDDYERRTLCDYHADDLGWDVCSEGQPCRLAG